MKSENFGMSKKLCSSLILLGLLTSCAGMNEYRPYARHVSRTTGHAGVIAVKLDHRQEDISLAQSMMQDSCGQRAATIIQEGEVAVGSVSDTVKERREGNESVVGSFFGLPVTSGSPEKENSRVVTTQQKEWHINYKCS